MLRSTMAASTSAGLGAGVGIGAGLAKAGTAAKASRRTAADCMFDDIMTSGMRREQDPQARGTAREGQLLRLDRVWRAKQSQGGC